MMLYAITFLCFGVNSCSLSQEMERYAGLYVYQTIDACKVAANHLVLPAGVSVGCVDLNSVIQWLGRNP